MDIYSGVPDNTQDKFNQNNAYPCQGPMIPYSQEDVEAQQWDPYGYGPWGPWIPRRRFFPRRGFFFPRRRFFEPDFPWWLFFFL